MNRSTPSTELLSAYLDGELSPAEQAALESALAKQAELREELEQLRELSARLRQLSRPVAPLELAGAVQERIVRLPAPLPQHAVPARWQQVGAALATLAACLLVAVALWQPGERHVDFGGVAMQGAAAPAAATEMAPEALQLPEGLAMSAGVPFPAAMPPGAAAESLGPPASWLLPGTRVPDVGELLSHLDQIGDEPVLVEYAVADVQEAFGQFQVLLSANGIRSLNTAVAIDHPSPKLLALYLEADDRTLGNTLQQFSNCAAVVSVHTPTAAELEQRFFKESGVEGVPLAEPAPQLAENRSQSGPVRSDAAQPGELPPLAILQQSARKGEARLPEMVQSDVPQAVGQALSANEAAVASAPATAEMSRAGEPEPTANFLVVVPQAVDFRQQLLQRNSTVRNSAALDVPEVAMNSPAQLRGADSAPPRGLNTAENESVADSKQQLNFGAAAKDSFRMLERAPGAVGRRGVIVFIESVSPLVPPAPPLPEQE